MPAKDLKYDQKNRFLRQGRCCSLLTVCCADAVGAYKASVHLRLSAEAVHYAPASSSCYIQLALTTCGTFQLPSMIEGGVSFGQYIRSIRTKSPFGAGSQFASLSAPGDSLWK